MTPLPVDRLPAREPSGLTAAVIRQAVINVGLSPLADQAAEQFEAYAEVLIRWNARLNLTALRTPRQVLERHFLECIFCAQQMVGNPQTLLDFGSGAGFPGIPIAICRPEIAVTLAEANGRKAAFLREALRVTGTRATVYDHRVEQMGSGEFDVVTMRAVDKMAEAILVARGRIGPGGSLVLLTTSSSDWTDKTAGWPVRSLLTVPQSEDRLLLQLSKP